MTDPPTPEERLEQLDREYMQTLRRWGSAPVATENEDILFDLVTTAAQETVALRDMIASRDAEMDRLLAVLNRHDNALTVLAATVARLRYRPVVGDGVIDYEETR